MSWRHFFALFFASLVLFASMQVNALTDEDVQPQSFSQESQEMENSSSSTPGEDDLVDNESPSQYPAEGHVGPWPEDEESSSD